MSEDKPVMKTLANCTPVEFLRQTNRIRHAAADLLKKADISEIRKRMPPLSGDETPEQKQKAMREQGKKNFSDILDALMETNAEDTAAVIGMMCFQNPNDVESATGMEYLSAGLELIQSKPVMDFFLMLMGSAQTSTDG